jgi:hypothetical protein
VFIIQGKPREPEGIVKVTKTSRADALKAALEFLDQGMPFVTIVADGRVYTAEEFAVTVINDEVGNAPRGPKGEQRPPTS